MTMSQADSPVTGFRPFFNPATGEWITYTAIAADNHGQLVRFTWRSVPGGVITEHIHPHQEERFTILAGQAHFTLNGQHHVAGAGETVVVPAGVPHSEGNPGPGEIEGIVELRPALHAKELHEAFAGLVADGKTTPRGAPRNPLQLGATFWHFRHESRVTSPPIWVQNLMLPPLWALAKAFGLRPYYDRWDSRIPDAGAGQPQLPATDQRQRSTLTRQIWLMRARPDARASARKFPAKQASLEHAARLPAGRRAVPVPPLFALYLMTTCAISGGAQIISSVLSAGRSHQSPDSTSRRAAGCLGPYAR
jgi:quercetin dioxygenase-like cupin family protein